MDPRAVTDDDIRQLRKEAAQAGDLVQVALCDVALAESPSDPVPESVEAVQHELEWRGVDAWSIFGTDKARELCVRAILDARAQQDSPWPES